MKQFKRAQVVILPTKKDNISINDLILNIFDKTELAIVTKHNIFANETFRFGKYGITFRNNYSHNGFENQHLYIISDDEIKEGDWAYSNEFEDNLIFKVDKKFFDLGIEAKKIIATTNILLQFHTDYHGEITNDENKKCYNHNLSQPSQQFITKYIKEYNKGNIIIDVLVEYEEIYNDYGETDIFDLVCTNHSKISKIKINPKDNTITIKKLKDSWNREEIIAIHKKNCERLTNSYTSEDFKWINQNL